MRVVNIFGGPGVGKSVAAARLFVEIRCRHAKAELVTEFVKGLVYSGNFSDVGNSLYTLAGQDRSLQRLEGRVDVAITDSPLPLCLLYARGRCDSSWFRETVMSAFNSYDNDSYFLRRKWDYQPWGRYQTESEARALDERLEDLLYRLGVEYTDGLDIDAVVEKYAPVAQLNRVAVS